jgi:thiamine-monophosphate kinase
MRGIPAEKLFFSRPSRYSGPSVCYRFAVRENALLQHVYAANADLPPFVTIPPGDDMAALRLDDPTLLIAVDQVADGVHFELANTPLELVGRKALTRNLSDIAAMAAQPVAAVVAVCLPRDFGQDRATALFDALRQTAAAFDCPLVGGDISVWDGKLLLSVTVLARPWPDTEPVTRTGAQVGDAIYVTGTLGHSFPTGHHLRFEPRLELARHLVTTSGSTSGGAPTAMIDLSDGIAQDLPRLVEHAEVHARILPVRHGETAPGRAPWQHALGDGEDYELLFTAPPEAEIPHAFGDEEDGDEPVLITRIGTVTNSDGIVVVTPDGERLSMAECFPTSGGGWEHGA